jgi:hypothetical protein
MLLKLLTTHAKPHRKDELAQAVATFLEDAFPAAGPGTTEVLDPGDLESS